MSLLHLESKAFARSEAQQKSKQDLAAYLIE
jgi:hypothetical protein